MREGLSLLHSVFAVILIAEVGPQIVRFMKAFSDALSWVETGSNQYTSANGARIIEPVGKLRVVTLTVNEGWTISAVADGVSPDVALKVEAASRSLVLATRLASWKCPNRLWALRLTGV